MLFFFLNFNFGEWFEGRDEALGWRMDWIGRNCIQQWAERDYVQGVGFQSFSISFQFLLIIDL